MKYVINYKELESYLKSLSVSDFQSAEYLPNGIIKEAKFKADIEHFGRQEDYYEQNQIIDLGMPFLVDAIGNDLSICIFTRRKFRILQTGRLINAKLINTIIEDCHKLYGQALNGCWVIPEKFIIKK